MYNGQQAGGSVSLVRCMDHDPEARRPADVIRIDYAFSDPVYHHIFESQLTHAQKWVSKTLGISVDISSPVTEFGSKSYIDRRNLYQTIEDRYRGGMRAFVLHHGATTIELERLTHVPVEPGVSPSH